MRKVSFTRVIFLSQIAPRCFLIKVFPAVRSFFSKISVCFVGWVFKYESFKSDLDMALTSAKLAGVIHIIITGTDLASSREAYNLTKLKHLEIKT